MLHIARGKYREVTFCGGLTFIYFVSVLVRLLGFLLFGLQLLEGGGQNFWCCWVFTLCSLVYGFWGSGEEICQGLW